ncbi:GTP-binding protein GEM-like isoform X8 [Ruditapes philippinarum]|uniref:GTP-binding protein GEM-like isoform X8 n=1 Tax=Ruditapes philippinarum TaxID=129788 RepID=UPI00295B6D9C|nr:GTP-binding protein GEM-like isoform X8 [Ruditapes philippinarum]
MEVLTSEDPVRIRRARSFRERSENTGENLRRVRSFKTTSKGLINRGDSFKIQRASPQVGKTNEGETIVKNTVTNLEIPKFVTANSGLVHCYFRVLITGAEGVGKSAIIDQFMTSEFLGYGNFNISQSEGERTVTLQVDGEESTLEFVQSEDFQDQDESFQIDGFVVVYCITERATFDIAIDLLKQIRDEVGSNKAIILVGNKSDLVRKRTISQEEGRSAADAYGCKYIELSAALNHRVDELLVGIHKQIKLKSDAENEELECKIPKGKERKSSFKRTKRFLEKVFLGHSGKDKKTENLYVD